MLQNHRKKKWKITLAHMIRIMNAMKRNVHYLLYPAKQGTVTALLFISFLVVHTPFDCAP